MRALFQAGEFSHSLVDAYEGMRRRRSMTFEHGIYQANETIEDCVGRNTSPVALLLLYPWIRKLQDYRAQLIGQLEEDEFVGACLPEPLSRNRRYQSLVSDRARRRSEREREEVEPLLNDSSFSDLSATRLNFLVILRTAENVPANVEPLVSLRRRLNRLR